MSEFEYIRHPFNFYKECFDLVTLNQMQLSNYIILYENICLHLTP